MVAKFPKVECVVMTIMPHKAEAITMHNMLVEIKLMAATVEVPAVEEVSEAVEEEAVLTTILLHPQNGMSWQVNRGKLSFKHPLLYFLLNMISVQ